MQEVLENIQKDINKQLNKIKPLRKIKKWNNKNKKILYENNKLTKLGAFIIFMELYSISNALIKGETKKCQK